MNASKEFDNIHERYREEMSKTVSISIVWNVVPSLWS